jgi:L-malate glycosyltransferase
MLGPINVAEFREYLYPEFRCGDLPTGLGGTPVNLLVKELIKRNRHVVVISLDPAVTDEVVLEGENLRICIGPFRPKRARDFFRVERDYLARTIRRERPSILHAQWTYEYALAAQISGIPHVITAHDAPINVLRLNFIPYRIARTLMAYRVLMRARIVISVSPYVAGHLRRFMCYRGPQQVVPNGMPNTLFERMPVKRQARSVVTFMTILVGWSARKNGHVAIQAFAQIRQHHASHRLIMVGAGYGPGESAERWATEHRMTEGIEFVGHAQYQHVIERLANEADVLVHPALEEAQPMVLIEAMALGVPVIGGRNSGGVPWTLGDGSGGALVDVTSPTALSAAMSDLACDAEKRELLGGRGRALAKGRFHISVVADAYEGIYERLAKNG